MNAIKNLLKSLLVSLVLVSGATAVAQTFERSFNALQQKDYETAFLDSRDWLNKETLLLNTTLVSCTP